MIVFLTACKSENDSADQTEESKVATILPTGIPFAELGQSMELLSQTVPNPETFADSLQADGGFAWWVRALPYEGGNIFFEGEFIDERNYSEEKLYSSKVNRIRIETPALATEEGIHIGSTFKKLMEVKGDKTLTPTPIPSLGYLDVEDEAGHIHYLFKLDQEVFQNILEQANLLSVIPEETPVSMIVIM